jgi:type II secretory pathway pseudopilin PulG
VELLTVVVIISMLAGMSMLVLTSTITAAKESKTRGIIAKLDAAILDIYESYQERFDNILNESNYGSYTGTLTAKELAQLKLHLMYDLMRMEMPSYWNEITADPGVKNTPIDPISITFDTHPFSFVLTQLPPVYSYYISEAGKIQTSGNPDYDNGPAEMLFLIIANLNPEALENFHGSEIGDTNNNGAREFLDAWGRPIYFFRFAPGFTGSDLQPDVVRMAKLPLATAADNTELWNPLPTAPWSSPSPWADIRDVYNTVMKQFPDPFDPYDPNDSRDLREPPSDPPDSNTSPEPYKQDKHSWFLYPLVISAGADGFFDIAFGRRENEGENKGKMKPPSTSAEVNPFNYPTGIPQDYENSGAFHHYDNIHNHRSSNSF